MKLITIITNKISLDKLHYYQTVFASIGYKIQVVIK